MINRVLSDDAVATLLQPIRDALDTDDGLIIQTSGTLGTPKQVRLSSAALRASAQATIAFLGGPGQWLVALSPSVVAGAQMFVRSVLAKSTPVVSTGQFQPETFVAAARLMTGTRRYTSLVPVQLARLLDYCGGHPEVVEVLKRFDAMLIGGQALPAQLRERALDLGLRIVRTYGGTETAGGCVYDGVPIGDTRVRIYNGEILISGSCLAEGYDNDEALTRERFTFLPDGDADADADADADVDQATHLTDERTLTRWFHTRDAGTIVTNTSGQQILNVTGRIDRALTSGGVTVSLDALEARVRQRPGWQSAVVLAVPDETWGERPVIVREAGIETLGDAETFEQIQQLIVAEMGRVAMPDRCVTVEQIPLLESGKPHLRALTDLIFGL